MKDYRDRIKHSLDGWYGCFESFQNLDFLKIHARHHNLKIIKFGRVYGSFASWPIFGFTTGFIGNPENRDPEFCFLKELAGTGAAAVKVHTNVRVNSIEHFRISTDDQYDMVVDVYKSDDELLKSFESKRRRNIRRALKKGVIFETSKKREDFDRVYELCLNTSCSGRIFKLPPKEYVYELIEKNFAVLAIVKYRDKVISGFVGVLVTSVHGMLLSLDRNYSSFLPSDVLCYGVMRWARDNGYRYMCFGHQSLSAVPSLTRYKMSYNPYLIPTYDYEIILNPSKFRLLKFVKLIIGQCGKFRDKDNSTDFVRVKSCK